MERLFNLLRLDGETRGFDNVIENLQREVVFRGASLWILVFAILIASLGLNVNSTAVVIGAMLVSPLMGPIMGLGIGMAINDLDMLKRSAANYSFALVAGLAASTVYFALTPLKDPSPEIIARTSPNVYDVLIALFGGFAGVLAYTTNIRGNVIPGVAIATALMPPLCAAGYGLANWNMPYFGGALYLFAINTVFIAWAGLLTSRLLRFPLRQLADPRAEALARHVVWVVVLVTFLPSVYFAWDVVERNQFRSRAERFIEAEAVFPNDYLLKKTIDGKAHSITLIFGGEHLPDDTIVRLRSRLEQYGLEEADLQIRQGFSYLSRPDAPETDPQVTALLDQREKELNELEQRLAGYTSREDLRDRLLVELQAMFPAVADCILRLPEAADEHSVLLIELSKPLADADREKATAFARARAERQDMAVYFQTATPTPSATATASPN